MARPIKNSCDYFPHDKDMRNHKKIKAIRTKYGITGYAIWSMILEHLTGSGEIPLKENEILNSILRENGKITGYLTGNVAYNVMGLTTQISNEYIIATYGFRKPLQKGRIKARFVRAYANIEQNNIPLLQLLDSIKDIKSIPGVETNTALELIKIKLQALSLNEVKLLTQIALNYPPATRALTGALLELLKFDTLSKKLFNSLNFLSKYKFSINEKILPNKNKWKIE